MCKMDLSFFISGWVHYQLQGYHEKYVKSNSKQSLVLPQFCFSRDDWISCLQKREVGVEEMVQYVELFYF